MRKLHRVLLAIVIGVLPLLAGPVGQAQAATVDNMWFGCYVSPYLTYPPTYSETCYSLKPNKTYGIAFRVFNPPTGSTFAWTITGGTIASGCTSTSSICNVYPPSAIRTDREVTAAVSVNGGAPFYSYAYIGATCVDGEYPFYSYYFC